MEPEEIHGQLAKCLYKKDLAAAALLYDEKAMFVPGSDRERAVGREAIKKELEIFLPVAASMKPVSRSIHEHGSLALVKLVWSMQTDEGEKTFTALEVLKKTEQGRWLYLIDNPYGI